LWLKKKKKKLVFERVQCQVGVHKLEFDFVVVDRRCVGLTFPQYTCHQQLPSIATKVHEPMGRGAGLARYSANLVILISSEAFGRLHVFGLGWINQKTS
jgi:hypothetical protein